ncbi:MAG: cbb3-type cytochrome c oxidase subunit I [Rhodopirellula sp. JB055]|uniref:cbb3-type cytochrome c oxidase subunit I n=1 Tax=Rhodopirellula sp. JB055 TaxID=3342846 RepID=UPI00370B8C93
MTAVQGRDDTSVADALALHRRGTRIGNVLATTDHKVVGHLYLATSFTLFLVAGLMAMVIRAELLEPGLQVVDNQQYNQMFTIHGTIMLLLFAPLQNDS